MKKKGPQKKEKQVFDSADYFKVNYHILLN